jgi:hypothetical protein
MREYNAINRFLLLQGYRDWANESVRPPPMRSPALLLAKSMGLAPDEAHDVIDAIGIRNFKGAAVSRRVVQRCGDGIMQVPPAGSFSKDESSSSGNSSAFLSKVRIDQLTHF